MDPADFGPERNQEALAGDLNEAFQQGRSKAWYWRQVLAAIRWRRLLYPLLISVLLGWWLTSPIMGPTPFFLNRPIDMAMITADLFCQHLCSRHDAAQVKGPAGPFDRGNFWIALALQT